MKNSFALITTFLLVFLPANLYAETVITLVKGKKIGCRTIEDGDVVQAELVKLKTVDSEQMVTAVIPGGKFKKRQKKISLDANNSTGKRNKARKAFKKAKKCLKQNNTSDGESGSGKGGSSGGGSGGGSEGGGSEGGGSGGGSEGNGNGSASDAPCDVVGDDSTISTRIINGNKCSIGNSPVVEIFINNNEIPAGVCTGTVVTSRAVIFAAHCVDSTTTGFNPSSVTIVPGGDDSSAITTSNFTFNTGYDSTNGVAPGKDDIAIAITSSDIPTRTIGLLQTNDLEEENAIIAGYGLQDSESNPGVSSGDRDGNLYAGKMTIAVVSTDEIRATFDYDDETTPGENSNTCSGDSGGPMLVFRSGEWLLAGITSYGIVQNCGPTDLSGFANVTSPTIRSFLSDNLPEVLE